MVDREISPQPDWLYKKSYELTDDIKLTEQGPQEADQTF